MGIGWDIEELIGFSDTNDGSKGGSEQLPRNVRIPLAISVAPQFFKSIIDEYKNKYSSMMQTKLNSGGKKVTEIGNLSSEDARALLTRIGPMAAAAQPKDSKE